MRYDTSLISPSIIYHTRHPYLSCLSLPPLHLLHSSPPLSAPLRQSKPLSSHVNHALGLPSHPPSVHLHLESSILALSWRILGSCRYPRAPHKRLIIISHPHLPSPITSEESECECHGTDTRKELGMTLICSICSILLLCCSAIYLLTSTLLSTPTPTPALLDWTLDSTKSHHGLPITCLFSLFAALVPGSYSPVLTRHQLLLSFPMRSHVHPNHPCPP